MALGTSLYSVGKDKHWWEKLMEDEISRIMTKNGAKMLEMEPKSPATLPAGKENPKDPMTAAVGTIP